MSWQAVADVLENSPSYGADRLVEIAIAERADEEGRNSHGSMADIARRANLGHFRDADTSADDYLKRYESATRAARRSVRKLEELGRIDAYGETSRGVSIHRIKFGDPGQGVPPDRVSGVEEGTPDEVSGAPRTRCPGTPDEVSPEPSLNPNPKSQIETKQQSSSSKKEQHQKTAEEAERRKLLDSRDALQDQLKRKPGHGPTLRALEQVRSELLALDVDTADLEAAEHEVDVWARRLAEQVTPELVPA